MAVLEFDKLGEHIYETGVEKGVLYPFTAGAYGTGVAWNGLINVTESPSGAEPTPLYAGNIKYLNLMSVEEFGASIEAYTYPDEFAECDGSAVLGVGVSIGQQIRKPFGLCYKTKIGNDILGEDYGYKLNIIYGAMAKPSEKAHATTSDSPEAATFSWELTTTPIAVPGFKPTASLTIDSTKITAAKLSAIEDKLYGTATTEPQLLTPTEIKAILDAVG